MYYYPSASFGGEKLLSQITLFVSSMYALTLSHCIPTPPCLSCDFAHARRVSVDCRRYVHCFDGIPGQVQTCGYNEVFSLREGQCISYRAATKECLISPGGFKSKTKPHLLVKNYPRFQGTSNGYPYIASSSDVSNYYANNWLTKGRLSFRNPLSRQSHTGFWYLNDQIQRGSEFVGFGSSLDRGNSDLGLSSRLRDEQLYGKCGLKASNWIVGGQEAGPGRWAWQVSLQELNVTSGRWAHVCGGALVHGSWIVTAGHCIHALSGVSSVTALLGSYNLTITEPDEVRVKVDNLIGHPGYRHGGNYPNDVGLVHLAAPVRMTRSIHTVCLPKQEESVHSKSQTLHGPNSRCWVTGWGRTLGATDGHVLNEAEVELIDREICAASWSGYITPSHMCAAGRAGAGACEGDSGGPLTCIHAGRYYLEGVVSWGENSCRLAGYPSVFTRVALFTDWIRRTVNSFA